MGEHEREYDAWTEALAEWGDGPRTMKATADWANKWIHQLRTASERSYIESAALRERAEKAERERDRWRWDFETLRTVSGRIERDAAYNSGVPLFTRLRDRAEAAEAQVAELRAMLICTETKYGKHEWRPGQWDDARERLWCCRCARTATDIIDSALARTAPKEAPDANS